HEALGLSDRIAVMNAGRIDQLGTPREVYERPATRFVADFIGASTVLDARAVDAGAVEISGGLLVDVRLPRPLVPGARVRRRSGRAPADPARARGGWRGPRHARRVRDQRHVPRRPHGGEGRAQQWRAAPGHGSRRATARARGPDRRALTG